MTWHYNWTNQSNSLSDSEKYENAEEIWDLFINTYGWTEEATAAVISNFEHEGLLNPAQWQIGSTIGTWESNTVGLGLGQWTPASKIGDYCGGRDQAHVEDGAKQIQCVIDDPYGQWVQRINSRGYSTYYQTSGLLYITSIDDFSISEERPEDLATCWCACWEGCNRKAFKDTFYTRRSRARYWYEEFVGGTSGNLTIITINGNGTAEANPIRQEVGSYVTIEATPDGNDNFISWSVISGGITLNAYDNPQTFQMGNDRVEIQANFTGETPIPPEPRFLYIPHKMPVWMYPYLKNR